MTFIPEVTRFEMQQFGFSAYLIRQITKGLASRREWGYKIYSASEIENAIAQKLAKPRTQPNTRTVLENFLLRLRGDSNVVRVDFGKTLDNATEIQMLYTKIEQTNKQRKEVLRRVDQVLVKADRVLEKTKKTQVG
ncbi:MAG: hypothetical protein F6J87_24545 [Spirulina sp. SIO3F2]|nr:hypothetical protein [Spirulina sp. SIO3F2]